MRGRKALVTGGAKGIGHAIASRLAAEGVEVSVLGRDEAALARSGFSYAVADVTDSASLGVAIDRLGRFDILVNNAGGAYSAPFARHSRADWDTMLSLNLTGCYTTIQYVLPGMMQRGWGRIVSVASTAGLKGYAYTTAYCAAKHGVIGLTRAPRRRVGPHGCHGECGVPWLHGDGVGQPGSGHDRGQDGKVSRRCPRRFGTKQSARPPGAARGSC